MSGKKEVGEEGSICSMLPFARAVKEPQLKTACCRFSEYARAARDRTGGGHYDIPP